MRIVRLQQGSLEWHAWRHEGLGGSDVASAMGLSPFEDATPKHLFAEKVRGLARETTFAMRRGVRLEDKARQLFERRMNRSFPPVCIEHSDEPWMRCSLDGLSVHDGFPTKQDPPSIFEVKAPNWKVHDHALSGIVPDYYEVQCQWQLLVSGYDLCHFVSFNDGQKFAAKDHLAHVRVRADAELQAEILEAAQAFWDRVLETRGEAVFA